MNWNRVDFEAHMRKLNACVQLGRQSFACGGAYRTVTVERAWKLWQASARSATERAAKLSATLANDAAIKYAGGYPVDFEQEVAAAIRAGGKQ